MTCFQQRFTVAQPFVQRKAARRRFYLRIGAAKGAAELSLPALESRRWQGLRRTDQQIEIAVGVDNRNAGRQRVARTAGDAPRPRPRLLRQLQRYLNRRLGNKR